jgi:hypothetical protein
MSAPPPFTLVLCEGFHDRSFLAGALVERLGWKEPAIDAEGRRLPYQDRWGKVAGADFGYLHGVTGAQLRLRPCHGHTRVPDVVRRTLQSRATHSFDRLLINYDGDKGGDGPGFLARIHQSVREMLVRFGAAPDSAGEGRFLIDGGAREVRTVVWHCDDAAREGVPEQQCLERLLCSASAAVWPGRAESLGRWLRERPEPSVRLDDVGGIRQSIAKTYGWTLMGAWFAEHGCDDFLRQVWSHDALAEQLRKRLSDSGAWGALESCAAARE